MPNHEPPGLPPPRFSQLLVGFSLELLCHLGSMVGGGGVTLRGPSPRTSERFSGATNACPVTHTPIHTHSHVLADTCTLTHVCVHTLVVPSRPYFCTHTQTSAAALVLTQTHPTACSCLPHLHIAPIALSSRECNLTAPRPAGSPLQLRQGLDEGCGDPSCRPVSGQHPPGPPPAWLARPSPWCSEAGGQRAAGGFSFSAVAA